MKKMSSDFTSLLLSDIIPLLHFPTTSRLKPSTDWSEMVQLPISYTQLYAYRTYVRLQH